MQLYVISNGEQQGPFTPEQIKGFLNMGHFQHTDMAWHEGLPEWKPLGQFPEFAPRAYRTPNYKAMAYTKVGPEKKRKSKSIIATVLFLVVAGAVGGGGYYYWQAQQKKKAELAAQEAAAAAAAKNDTGDKFPKTAAALNRWYEEPAAGQNAAVFFQKGFDALEITDADSKSYTLPLFGKGALPAATVAVPGGVKNTLTDFLERNKPALAFFQQAASCSGSRYPFDPAKGLSAPAPHLAKVRQTAQLAELSAIFQADAREGDGAGQGVLLALATGRSLEAEPLMISQLVRVACYGIAIDALEQTVHRVTLPAQTLTQLQTAFNRAADYEAAGNGFNRALVGERVLSMATFDLPAEKLQEAISGGRTATPAGQNVALGNLKEQRQYFEETLNEFITARKEPLPARLKADDTIAPRVTEAQSKGYVVVTAMMPALARITAKEAASLARLRLAQTAVALEQARAAGGSYPAALSELAPKFLPAVPADPFDGQPVRYRKAGEGYILYSVGADLKDDGGMRRAGSDDAIFSVAKPPKP